MRLSLLLLLAVAIAATDVPDWCRVGIVAVETRSYWTVDGRLHYVDKRRGTSGERGVAQMTRAAFNQIKRRGEQFWQIEADRYFAEDCMCRYLSWLFERTKSWDRAVACYNGGLGNPQWKYLAKVRKAGAQ